MQKKACSSATGSPADSQAIEALGLSPAELAQRGYPLDGEVANPAVAPEHEPVNVSAKSRAHA
jgi:hypothetical protein